jgi:catechol 2,3-dioxygenase-like lactoylglutathione lyase family enzyme
MNRLSTWFRHGFDVVGALQQMQASSAPHDVVATLFREPTPHPDISKPLISFDEASLARKRALDDSGLSLLAPFAPVIADAALALTDADASRRRLDRQSIPRLRSAIAELAPNQRRIIARGLQSQFGSNRHLDQVRKDPRGTDGALHLLYGVLSLACSDLDGIAEAFWSGNAPKQLVDGYVALVEHVASEDFDTAPTLNSLRIAKDLEASGCITHEGLMELSDAIFAAGNAGAGLCEAALGIQKNQLRPGFAAKNAEVVRYFLEAYSARKLDAARGVREHIDELVHEMPRDAASAAVQDTFPKTTEKSGRAFVESVKQWLKQFQGPSLTARAATILSQSDTLPDTLGFLGALFASVGEGKLRQFDFWVLLDAEAERAFGGAVPLKQAAMLLNLLAQALPSLVSSIVGTNASEIDAGKAAVCFVAQLCTKDALPEQVIGVSDIVQAVSSGLEARAGDYSQADLLDTLNPIGPEGLAAFAEFFASVDEAVAQRQLTGPNQAAMLKEAYVYDLVRLVGCTRAALLLLPRLTAAVRNGEGAAAVMREIKHNAQAQVWRWNDERLREVPIPLAPPVKDLRTGNVHSSAIDVPLSPEARALALCTHAVTADDTDRMRAVLLADIPEEKRPLHAAAAQQEIDFQSLCCARNPLLTLVSQGMVFPFQVVPVTGRMEGTEGASEASRFFAVLQDFKRSWGAYMADENTLPNDSGFVRWRRAVQDAFLALPNRLQAALRQGEYMYAVSARNAAGLPDPKVGHVDPLETLALSILDPGPSPLAHVERRVRSIEASLPFYTGVLDLEVVRRGGDQVTLSDGRYQIHLREDLSFPPYEVQATSFDHLAFAGLDYEAAKARLSHAGLAYEERTPGGEQDKQLFFRDPSGNRLELIVPESFDVAAAGRLSLHHILRGTQAVAEEKSNMVNALGLQAIERPSFPTNGFWATDGRIQIHLYETQGDVPYARDVWAYTSKSDSTR